MDVPAAPNRIWSLDFMSDALYHGRRFRVLNVLEEGVREALDIVVDTSIPSGRVVRVLEQLKGWRRLPRAIRCDNRPEIFSQVFVDWCRDHEVEISYMEPGKPNQNGEDARITVLDQLITVHPSGMVAWFAEVADWDFKAAGHPVHAAGCRISGVLEKRNGRWVLIQFHGSMPAAG